MAFQNKNLSVIAYANGFTLWHYAAAETMAVISATGYFNDVKTLMNIGDVVIINGSDNTAIKKINITDAGNVTVAGLSGVTAD
ncbi:hypothetical protein HDR63_03155 [bacterium]|nr:hypothetical protein [bacterium]